MSGLSMRRVKEPFNLQAVLPISCSTFHAQNTSDIYTCRRATMEENQGHLITADV